MEQSIADKMRDACLTPVFTVDQAVIKATNCSTGGMAITSDKVEPQEVEIPRNTLGPKGIVDTISDEPGEPATGTQKPAAEPVIAAPVAGEGAQSGGGLKEWVKKNPWIAAGAAAAVLLMALSNRRS